MLYVEWNESVFYKLKKQPASAAEPIDRINFQSISDYFPMNR